MYHTLHVSACKIMSFEIIPGHAAKACFMSLYKRTHDYSGGNLSDAHQDQLQQRDMHAADLCGNPQEERAIVKKHCKQRYYYNA